MTLLRAVTGRFRVACYEAEGGRTKDNVCGRFLTVAGARIPGTREGDGIGICRAPPMGRVHMHFLT